MSDYGLFIKGKMLGARQQPKRNGQGYYNEIGVELEIPNGFGGVKQDLIIIRGSQSLVNAGVLNCASKLTGKFVQIPVYVRPWSMDGREGVTYNLSSDSVIKETKKES
ncbi:DNA-binding protein [Salmonella enterica subsp. enterica serovar Anatum]